MDVAELARWRDAAIIFLVLEVCLMALVPAALLYRSLQAVGPLRSWLLPRLSRVCTSLCRLESVTRRELRALARPFVWLQSTAAGLHRALEYLDWR